MRNLFAAISILIIPLYLFSQNIEKAKDSLLTEGRLLYKSEMASWNGTDIFLTKYKQREKIGGYISYSDHQNATCIFFSKSENPKVIGTMTFDTTYDVNAAKVSLDERAFTEMEINLYRIRATALKTINNDTLFKVYKNTNLNLIPLIINGEKKVYVLTGSQENGVVIFGNDYLMRFNENNELIQKKQLHRNVIFIKNEETGKDETVFGTTHTHLPETGEFITATDICTLMLYEKFTKWKQHLVISSNFISIWDCNSNNLSIMPKNALESSENKEPH